MAAYVDKNISSAQASQARQMFEEIRKQSKEQKVGSNVSANIAQVDSLSLGDAKASSGKGMKDIITGLSDLAVDKQPGGKATAESNKAYSSLMGDMEEIINAAETTAKGNAGGGSADIIKNADNAGQDAGFLASVDAHSADGPYGASNHAYAEYTAAIKGGNTVEIGKWQGALAHAMDKDWPGDAKAKEDTFRKAYNESGVDQTNPAMGKQIMESEKRWGYQPSFA